MQAFGSYVAPPFAHAYIGKGRLREINQDGMQSDLEAALFFPDPRADPHRPSPFIQAAFKGHVDVVEYVVGSYPAPKYVDYTDTVHFDSSSAVHCCTALTAAAMRGHTEVARILLEAGASTEIRDCTGATPLCEAVFHNRPDVVRLLRERYRADVDAPNAFGWTPLHVAVDRGHRELTDYLLGEGGTDVSLTTPEGYTVLHVAAMKGRTHIVEKLLERGVVPPSTVENCSDKEGYVPSPLYLAAFYHHEGILQRFKKCCEISESVWHDVQLLKSARDPGRSSASLEEYLDSVRVLERCMGPRDPSLFWELSKLATDLWQMIHTFELGGQVNEEAVSSRLARVQNVGAVWSAVQAILTKSLELYEKNQLVSLRRGHLLPQSVAEEVGRWGLLCFVLHPLRRHDGSVVYPDFCRFTEFLLNVLNQTREQSRALRKEFGCEEDLPQSLLSSLFRCFQGWLAVTNQPNAMAEPHCRAERGRCQELGRKFVSLALYLPEGKTLLWALVGMDHTDIPPSTSLLESLLEWGASEVINVACPPSRDTPLHRLCSIFGANWKLFAGLSQVLVNHGAHLDMVDRFGETVHDIISRRFPLYDSTISEELTQLQPPVPPSLSCLVSRRLVEWGVASSPKLQDFLPKTVIRYVRLHENTKTTV